MQTLEINGKSVSVDVAADTPLLWVLRDHLHMTGTKYGCGKGLCGACTVHFDGQPLRSCQLPVSAAVGHKITTIEGLAADGLTPLQKAWVAVDVPQCGYCQSGQLMTASALLARNPNPSDEEIEEAMSGNVCRCGTYGKIRAAIHAAAQASPTESV